MEIEKHSDSEEEQEYSLPQGLIYSRETGGTFESVLVALHGNARLFVQSLFLPADNHLNLHPISGRCLASLHTLSSALIVIVHQKLDVPQQQQLVVSLINNYSVKQSFVLCNQLNTSITAPLFYKQTMGTALPQIRSIYEDYSKEIVDDSLITYLNKQKIPATIIIQQHLYPSSPNEISLFSSLIQQIGIKVQYDQDTLEALLQQEQQKVTSSSLYI